ncbi:hypothetical protein ACIQ1D_12400 [Lysinibacillus xylanilyticus]
MQLTIVERLFNNFRIDGSIMSVTGHLKKNEIEEGVTRLFEAVYD